MPPRHLHRVSGARAKTFGVRVLHRRGLVLFTTVIASFYSSSVLCLRLSIPVRYCVASFYSSLLLCLSICITMFGASPEALAVGVRHGRGLVLFTTVFGSFDSFLLPGWTLDL